jgi:protein-L-isoaspartate(D-aspartate) O-methyltransferase
VLQDSRLRQAFCEVPRHAFLPDVPVELVYTDRAFDLKRIDRALTSASSPPSMMAIMLEQLAPRSGDRVLEIGTGSGYNAALLSHLVGPRGRVTTLDVDGEIVATANDRLQRAGFGSVRALVGDGINGDEGEAPYDRIIATACMSDIPACWWDQLADAGRIVVPLVLRQSQTSIAFDRQNGHLASVSAACCSFIQQRGEQAGTQTRRTPVEALGVIVEASPDAVVDVEALADALCEPSHDYPSGVHISIGEYLFGLRLWLELELVNFCQLMASESALGSILVPPLVRIGGVVSSGFAYDPAQGLAALVVPPGKVVSIDDVNHVIAATTEFEVHVRQFGDGQNNARRLVASIRAWDDAGRPFRGLCDSLRVLAYRQPSRTSVEARLIVERPDTRFVVDW